jgi:protein-S-isoprenylcysteine O-methyltransferase Ste14
MQTAEPVQRVELVEPVQPVQRGARVRFPPPLVFLLCVLTGVAVARFITPAHVPLPAPLRLAIGLFVQLAAVALVASARVRFWRTRQSPVPWTPTPELIFDGPYRFTRNPMYVGVTLFMLGLGLTLSNLWISALAIPALVLVHFIAVRPEEKYLAEKFGAPYADYLARVRRYV